MPRVVLRRLVARMARVLEPRWQEALRVSQQDRNSWGGARRSGVSLPVGVAARPRVFEVALACMCVTLGGCLPAGGTSDGSSVSPRDRSNRTSDTLAAEREVQVALPKGSNKDRSAAPREGSGAATGTLADIPIPPNAEVLGRRATPEVLAQQSEYFAPRLDQAKTEAKQLEAEASRTRSAGDERGRTAPEPTNPSAIQWNGESRPFPSTLGNQWSETSNPAASGAPPAAPTATEPRASAVQLAETIARSIPDRGGSQGLAASLASAAKAIEAPDAPFDASTFTGLTPEEREIAIAFHATCQALGRDLAGGKAPTEAAAVLTGLVEQLKGEETILIPRAELCTRVDGFGKLTAIDGRRFLPGRSTQVILYTEVDQFSSEPNEKGEWATRLASKVAIFAKHDGTQVWTRDWQAVTDASSVRREDFFICEKVQLSEHLTLGTYILKSSVRDEKSGAIAERSIEFQMVADPAIASP